jgi:sec-independent protein translocase protein TatC
MDEKQPFQFHLKELRDRLLVSVIAVAAAFVVSYYFKEKVFHYLALPFFKVMPAQSSFIFTSITDAFIAYFKVALVSALFAASPVILYEAWMFVAPGLYDNERRYVVPFILFGSLFFIGGALFCYFVILPYTYAFFVSYGGEQILPMPAIGDYISLTLKLLLAFGLIFQMPVMAYYLARAGIISFKTLSKKRRYAVVIIVIMSAVIAPSEISSLLVLAIPMYGLYEMSVLIARMFGKKEAGNVAV